MKKLVYLIFILLGSTSLAQLNTVHLSAKMDGTHLLENGNLTNIWGFGYFSQVPIATLPAPLLIFQEGDSVEVKLTNNSGEAHTIHLHGLDVDQVNDGVPQTSFFVWAGQTESYKFLANHPGTFLYHCHVTTTLHLSLGMYGMLVVEREDQRLFENGPGYNQSYYYLASDLEIETNDDPLNSFPFHEIVPDYFMLNGLSGTMMFEDDSEIINAQAGDSIVLRLGNIAYSKTEFIFPEECNAVAYMSDGRALTDPLETDTLEIYPGERYSVIIKPDQMISDYIQVNYYSMLNNAYNSTNFIGINQNSFPVAIAESSPILGFSVYPNPSKDQVRLLNTLGIVDLINSNGKLIHSYQVNSSNYLIDLSKLLPGLYLLRNESGSTQKIIKL